MHRNPSEEPRPASRLTHAHLLTLGASGGPSPSWQWAWQALGRPQAWQAAAAAPTVTIKPSAASGQPVGTTITWTAGSTGLKTPVYQFSVSAGSAAAPPSYATSVSNLPSLGHR